MSRVKKYYIETYGCQMNLADSELVAGILRENDYQATTHPQKADMILVNTCSVRENADQRAIARLHQFKNLKKRNPRLILGLLGCVAQRDRGRIIRDNPFIDVVLGPDAYRRFPEVLRGANLPLVDVQLSKSEVYDRITPFREVSVNASISIMRGCDKFCAYCIVPFTRGRERSRSPQSVIAELHRTIEDGFREITLLGQNVNSYRWESYRFPQLLEEVAGIAPEQRIRFTSPHPQDVDDGMLEVMRSYPNICPHIHLPLQSGSTQVLRRMNRHYSHADYLKLVEKIRQYMPDIAITTDIIVGFPGESEEDFEETLDVMNTVRFDNAYMFKYSPRPYTRAAKWADDVPPEVKAKRLNRVIATQKGHSSQHNRALIGTRQKILIDDVSKKDENEKRGRTGTNKIVILKKGNPSIGALLDVDIVGASGVTLFGEMKK